MLVPLAIAALALFSYLWYLDASVSRSNIPRVGPPTVLGYIWSIFRHFFNARAVVEEGRRKFDGRPFIMPSLVGPTVVIGRNNMDSLHNQPTTASTVHLN